MKSMNDISAEHQLLDFLNPVSGLKSQVAFIFAVSLLMFLFLSPWIKQQHLAVFVLYKKLPLQAYKPKLSKSQHYEHSWKTLRASYLKGVSSSSSSLIAAVGAKGLHAVSPTLSVLSNRFGYFPARPLHSAKYVYKSVLNKRLITLPVVYSRPFASKAVFERS